MSINDIPTVRVNCPNGCCGFKVAVGKSATCPICKRTWIPDIPFSKDWAFNERLQSIADAVYSNIWQVKQIQRNLGSLDKDRGIDVHLQLVSGLTFDIQEKFRRAEARHYWQFTVEYKNNPVTGEPGEFYKLAANYYFYAYVNKLENCFTDWFIVDLNSFKEAYNSGLLKEDELRENTLRSKASFLCFNWSEMSPFIFRESGWQTKVR